MKKILSVSCLVGLVSLLFLSCDPNASLSPNGPYGTAMVNVKMMASVNEARSSISGRIMIDSINFGEASLGAAWLMFKQQSDSTDDESDSTDMEPDSLDSDEGNKLEGPFIFDLIAGTSTPSFEITPGHYKGLVVKLAPVLEDSNSLFISFDVIDSAETISVAFSSTTPRAFVVRDNENGFDFDGTDTQVLILFDLDGLFEGVDFSHATADENGVVQINKDSNRGLYNRINSNLSTAFKAGHE